MPSPRSRESRYYVREDGARRPQAEWQGYDGKVEETRLCVFASPRVGAEPLDCPTRELGPVNGDAHQLVLVIRNAEVVISAREVHREAPARFGGSMTLKHAADSRQRVELAR